MINNANNKLITSRHKTNLKKYPQSSNKVDNKYEWSFS